MGYAERGITATDVGQVRCCEISQSMRDDGTCGVVANTLRFKRYITHVSTSWRSVPLSTRHGGVDWTEGLTEEWQAERCGGSG